jgi:hypothetical protein
VEVDTLATVAEDKADKVGLAKVVSLLAGIEAVAEDKADKVGLAEVVSLLSGTEAVAVDSSCLAVVAWVESP